MVFRKEKLDTCCESLRALLVTAHPDDECMFFLPTIAAIKRQGYQVWLLCLSTGNSEGLGKVRMQELFHACSLLGIPRSQVRIVDDPSLEDGMRTFWPAEVISHHVMSFVDDMSPSLLVTFDHGGVSGHPNHVAVSDGVKIVCQRVGKRLRLLLLETTCVFRKYTGPFDALYSLMEALLRPKTTFFCWKGPILASRTMCAHESQLVWFRKLYILFSRYIFLNTLIEFQ